MLSEFGQVSHPKEFVADRAARGERDWSPSQKLPSTAILERQNRYARFNRLIRPLPFEGMPASLSLVIGHWSSVMGHCSSFLGPHSSFLIPFGGGGWLLSTPERRRPRIGGFRAGGSLAVAGSTPATQLLLPAK